MLRNEIRNQDAVLRLYMKGHAEANLKVSGISMEPVLFEGDVIHIMCGEYRIGDVLVFVYKHREILVHRYVGVSGNRLLCKGDNAFRLEDIEESAVFGKVDRIVSNGTIYQLPNFPESFSHMSKEIGNLFLKNRYDVSATKADPLYKEFSAAMKEYVTFRNQ